MDWDCAIRSVNLIKVILRADDGDDDGVEDEDGDGIPDEDVNDLQEDGSRFGLYTCNDGIDNDEDGDIDGDDSDCSVATDDEDDCADERDNDNDGYVELGHTYPLGRPIEPSPPPPPARAGPWAHGPAPRFRARPTART